MRPSEALALHREEVLDIIARHPVSNPRIFGSAVEEACSIMALAAR